MILTRGTVRRLRRWLAVVLLICALAPLLSGEMSSGETLICVDNGEDRPVRKRPEAAPDRFVWHGAHDRPLAITGIDEELTQRYIQQYTSPGGLSWLKGVMERAAPYLPFVRGEIQSRGLPPELAYLPVIESGYLSSAVSKSGAVGLWQFMKNSIAPFGLQVNDWMDERRDFYKSTSAALSKLEENYNYFGDWALALAAYNAGLGAIRRLCEKTGTRDYWDLSRMGHLKTETAHYVPKFLAVSHILSHPSTYNLEATWQEDPEWRRIPISKSVDLEMLAAAAEIDAGRLKMANRELNYGVTPGDQGYMLKATARDLPAIAAVLERDDIPLLNYYFHTLKSGDTLSALSRHYGVSVDLIVQSNPKIEPKYLKIGDRLIIPALKEAGPYPHSEENPPAFDGNHLVKKGETLWSIALAYDIAPELLAEANSMNLNDTLREGRSLKTPIK